MNDISVVHAVNSLDQLTHTIPNKRLLYLRTLDNIMADHLAQIPKLSKFHHQKHFMRCLTIKHFFVIDYIGVPDGSK
jgi:hypothetical protein